MISNIIEMLAHIVISIIQYFGYFGVFFCMAVESACIPLPSEIIMPFSGYLVYLGKMSIIWVTMAGALGNLAGSVIAYAVGYYGGRPFTEKYGRYFFMSKHDLDMADHWFSKYGELAVFASRMMPVIRTFISLPAGVSKMRFSTFCVYSLLGSIPWCYGLTYVGFKLGENWNTLGGYFHKADYAIAAILIVGLAVWIRRHFKG